tara:strand:+ start:3251 stop:3475 length:225 start_codon:yes stop_codon:yes gene_type:complete
MNKLIIDQAGDDMHDRLKAIHKRSDEILEQVKKTNGRVGRLEDWKSQLTGGLKVVLLVIGLFAFMIRMGWVNIS